MLPLDEPHSIIYAGATRDEKDLFMSPAKPKNTWSLITRMRLGLLLLFIPVLLLGSIYYLHMERTLRHE